MELKEKFKFLMDLSEDPRWAQFCFAWAKKLIEPGLEMSMIGDLLKIKNSYCTKYFKFGKLHREDGPALANEDIEKWYFEGKLHRDGGPAVYSKDLQRWYSYGKIHREDGPAEIDKGVENYYLFGRKLSAADFTYMKNNNISFGQWKKDNFKSYQPIPASPPVISPSVSRLNLNFTSCLPLDSYLDSYLDRFISK